MPVEKAANESKLHVNDGQRLLMLRTGLDLSQREFAKILGISDSGYRNYEKNVLQVPLGLRRKIGTLTTLDVNPLDPNQHPRRVLEALRRLSPDDLDPRLRDRMQRTATSSSETVKQVEGVPTTEQKRRLPLFKRLVAFRRYCLRSRTELYTRPRQIYNNIRDGAFMIALNYFFLKTLSLQLDFPFGAPKDQIDYMLVTSIGVLAVLAVAVFQAIPIGLRSNGMRR